MSEHAEEPRFRVRARVEQSFGRLRVLLDQMTDRQLEQLLSSRLLDVVDAALVAIKLGKMPAEISLPWLLRIALRVISESS